MVDVAMRDRNPKEGASDFWVRSGLRNGSTLKRSEAYERMNPRCASDTGDGSRRKESAFTVGNGERARKWETQ